MARKSIKKLSIDFDPPPGTWKNFDVKIFSKCGAKEIITWGHMYYINFLRNFQNFKIVWNGEKIEKKILPIGFDPPTLRKILIIEIFLSVGGVKTYGQFFFSIFSPFQTIFKISEKIYVEHASSITYLFEGSQWSTCGKLEYSFKS